MKGEVVHRQLLKLVCEGVEELKIVLQVDGRELLQLHLGQTDVGDLETAPKCGNTLNF